MCDHVCTPAAHYSHFQHSFAFVYLTSFVIKSLDLLTSKIYDIVSVFTELVGKSLTESQMNAVWGLTLCLKEFTLYAHFPFPCLGPAALVCVVLWFPNSSVDICKHGAVWMFFFPSFHNMMCFLFCVCFDPSLAAKRRCGEARARVALLCYFWQRQWLVAVEGRGDRRGYHEAQKTRGCLRDFCLEELLCNNQRLNVDECVVRVCFCVCSCLNVHTNT